MNKKLVYLSFLSVLLCGKLQSQISYSDIEFWVGSGTDTTLLVVDFQDGTIDSSYTWGYVHNGTHTGEDLLNAVAAADQNFHLNIDTASFGNFLQDIVYNQHQGIGGNPDYWGTWDGQDLAGLATNMGIGDTLVSGGIFGCSYMDFDPAVAPGQPWAAFNPQAFTFSDVNQWYGSGTDSTVLIVDFNNGTDTASLAWGYAFNDSIENLALLDSLAQEVDSLSVTIANGVVEITYGSLTGSVSSQDDWYGWTATNYGNWQLHYDQSVQLTNGEMLAFVFTQQLELQRPHVPQKADEPMAVAERAVSNISVYPNPARNHLNFEGDFDEVQLYTISGRKVRQARQDRMPVSDLKPGVYLLRFVAEGKIIAPKTIVVQ